MVVRLYKSSTFIQNLIIILVGAALWFPRFYELQAMQTDYQQPFFHFCFEVLQPFPYISMGVALLLLFVGAMVVQRSLYFDRLRISGHNFPILLFVMLSVTPHVAFYSPIIITALMLAVAMIFIFQIPEKEQNDHLVFFAAFFFGLATLFYLPSLFLMVLFIVLYFLGNFSGRKTGVAILGFLLPVIWCIAGLYLSSNLSIMIEEWTKHFLVFNLPQPDSDIASFVILSIVIFVYIMVISRVLLKLSERTTIIRRRIVISIFMALLIMLSAFFSYNFYEHLLLLSVPMVALISYYYNEDGEAQYLDYALIGCFVALVLFSFL